MTAKHRPTEFELIARYFAPLAAGAPGAASLGDDVALVSIGNGEELVLKTDAIVAGRHFTGEEPAGLIARKLLRVNLSDLAAKGARLALAARRRDALEKLADEIEQAGGVRPIVIPAHLSVRGEATKLATRAIQLLGGVDVLVNNAGIIRVKPFLETSLEELHKVLDTNLVGAFLGCQAVVPSMKARGGGSIVNFSSVQGLEGRDALLTKQFLPGLHRSVP